MSTLGTAEHAARVTDGRHPATVDALQWLCFAQLPEDLQAFSRPFYQTAVELILAAADSAELTKALNALIEAKNWAVMAGIRTTTGRAGPVPRPAEIVDSPKLTTAGGAYPAFTRPVRDNPQA